MSVLSFTCNSCLIQFRSSDLQRYHMKTEWHRYNLKRRVANLPPIDAALFAEKVQISEQERIKNQVDEFGFPLLKTQERLPRSRKQPRKVKKVVEPIPHRSSLDGNEVDLEILPPERPVSPAGSVISRISKLSVHSSDITTDFGEETVSEYGFTSESNFEFESGDDASTYSSGEEIETDQLSPTSCIFCGAKQGGIERNINHMFKTHGLYLPERSYLVNLLGLLRYLSEVIVVRKSCLCCGFQGSSLESIRAHMASKRHCRLPYESKEERERVSQFYDFSSLEERPDKAANTVNSRKIHFTEDTDNTDDTDYSNDETEDDMEHVCGANNNDINANYTVVPVDSTGMELTLPNGARVGHRSGQRYYRQNLPSQVEHNDSRRTVSAADRRLASGITERQFKTGLKNMQQLEKRALNQKIRKEKSSKINYQAHYRDELLQ